MAGTQPMVKDMFASAAFARRLFARIRRMRHASLAGGRLFLSVETDHEVPEPWFLSLMCLFDIPGASLKGAGRIVQVRRMEGRIYQLITDTVAPGRGDIVPLPARSSVKLVTRGGDHNTLLAGPRS